MELHPITDKEFAQVQKLLHDIAGISLSSAKKALVCSRLDKRLKQHGLHHYRDYLKLLHSEANDAELRLAIDLLTTNETYFFREPKHFDYLKQAILPELEGGAPVRVWSAACSSGPEPYSIAMVLADVLGDGRWDVIASDLSTRMLERAQAAHYPLEWAKDIPPAYLKQYCWKGVGAQAGTFRIDRSIRERVSFRQVNLNAALPDIGSFDVVFLRNVMIYFDQETKRQVVARLAQRLKPGGYLIVGHSESLNGIDEALIPIRPTVYRKR